MHRFGLAKLWLCATRSDAQQLEGAFLARARRARAVAAATTAAAAARVADEMSSASCGAAALRIKLQSVGASLSSVQTTLTLNASGDALGNYHSVLDAARELLGHRQPSLYSADGRPIFSDDVIWENNAMPSDQMSEEMSQPPVLDMYALRKGQMWVWLQLWLKYQWICLLQSKALY